MADQWLSIVEYARKFNISDMTVRRRIKTGKLQAILREGKYYIPADDRPASAPRSQNVVKPHPSAASTIVPTQNLQPNPPISNPASDQRYVPGQISQSLHQQSATSSIDNQSLLAFCEGALKKLSDSEIRLEQQYKQRLAQLEAELKSADLEKSQLSQQVEDLQVLVKILEKKVRTA